MFVGKPGSNGVAGSLDLLEVLRLERNLQGIDVIVEVFDLAAANDRKDVRNLLHQIRECDCVGRVSTVTRSRHDKYASLGRCVRTCLYVFRPDLFSDLLEHLADLALLLGALPVGIHQHTAYGKYCRMRDILRRGCDRHTFLS